MSRPTPVDATAPANRTARKMKQFLDHKLGKLAPTAVSVTNESDGQVTFGFEGIPLDDGKRVLEAFMENLGKELGAQVSVTQHEKNDAIHASFIGDKLSIRTMEAKLSGKPGVTAGVTISAA